MKVNKCENHHQHQHKIIHAMSVNPFSLQLQVRLWSDEWICEVVAVHSTTWHIRQREEAIGDVRRLSEMKR
jgi:prenyltransferase beta subunit